MLVLSRYGVNRVTRTNMTLRAYIGGASPEDGDPSSPQHSWSSSGGLSEAAIAEAGLRAVLQPEQRHGSLGEDEYVLRVGREPYGSMCARTRMRF